MTYRYGFDVPEAVLSFVEKAEADAEPQFQNIKKMGEYNTFKVLSSFSHVGVAERHFSPTTGYGYSDGGREKLAALFADIFGAEDAIVSPLVASGTHALTIALFAYLRPLDSFLSVTGRPYDTLTGVIGIDEPASGSLRDFAISYSQTDLKDGKIDTRAVLDQLILNPKIKLLYIQRSRGYELRPSLSVEEIGSFIAEVREEYPDIPVIVDNCYGEFTEELEPTEVGADLIVGSLIKNPGGGIAPTGAYFAGTHEAIALVGDRMTAPGIGMEIGSYMGGYLPYFQGIYFSPHVVAEALRGVCLASLAFERLGFEVFPRYDDKRTDLTQTIKFADEYQLVTFVRAVQKASPIDANVVPEPWDMPGYQDKVIMAAGTFMQGGSIELSADAPIRPPYAVFMQGGLTYENTKLAVMRAICDLELI